MLHIQNLSHDVGLPQRARKILFANTSLELNTRQSVGLLGCNGVGKSTLLQFIARLKQPRRGKITAPGRVSWPVGFSGSFHPRLSGAQNIRFAARLYDLPPAELIQTCQDFAQLGSELHVPVQTYSTGMRSRLAFALSLSIPFDLYLVDEVTAVGDETFRAKSRVKFLERMANAGAIMVNHNLPEMAELCQSGIVLHNARLQYFDHITDAIVFYRETLKFSL